MIAGTGRSGTTWLAEIVRSQVPCRVMFEPFNPRKVGEYRRFHYFQYMQPAERDAALGEYCQAVFTGNLRNRWVDRSVTILRPQYRLVKEIRANLMLRWIRVHFPMVPMLFVIRHPCAVVASRMKLGWATDGDIGPMLAQPRLIADHLADRMHVIRDAATPEEKHAVVWAVSNLVPLRQFPPGELATVFYEDLCTEPEAAVERVFGSLGHAYQTSVFDAVGEPSMMTSGSSAVLTGDDRVTAWQRELSPLQARRVLAVVDAFGLGHLYGDSAMPRRP